MTALRVRASAEAAAIADLVPVVASLPISLVGAEPGQRADVITVDGSRGWPGRVVEALLDELRGLLIVHPVPVPPNEVPEALTIPVVVDYRFAGNPALAAAAEQFGQLPPDALIEVAAIVNDAADLDGTLVDQLATLRRLRHPAASLARLTWGGAGYYLRGSTTQGSPLLLSAHVTSGAPARLRIRGLGPDIALEVMLPDPATARPAVAVHTTTDGATTTPTLWESSHRAAWRRLHSAVTDVRLTNDLADLRADLIVSSQVSSLP